MKAFLDLGCWGYENNDIKFCSGIKNSILDLTKNSQINLSVTEFLNDNYQLVRKPLLSNVHTCLFRIQDNYNVFSKEHFQAIENFCIMHKKCGLYLKIEWKD